MKFHLSIDADQPERVAKSLAWICAAEAYPAVESGLWIVVSEDDRGPTVEVRPRGEALQVPPAANGFAPFTVATHLSEVEVCAVGAAAGWPAARRSRGRFHVIELWVENRIMIEVLTPQMQADYLAAATPQARRAA
jgi:hypothetical protein